MSEESIDNLLNDEEPAVEQQPETIGQPRDESGRFAPKEETGVEKEKVEAPAPEPEPVPPTEPTDGLPKDVYAPLKAVRAENQELKQQIAALQQQFATQQRQQQPQPEFWEDPQSFLSAQFDQFGNQLMQRFEQQQTVKRVESSETAARAKYADFEDALSAFRQAAQANPSLIQQMVQNENPGEFAYTRGKSALQLEQYGSVDELLKAERAKWEAEAKAAMPAPSFPSTTATDGSVGARTGPSWSGPAPIDDLLR